MLEINRRTAEFQWAPDSLTIARCSIVNETAASARVLLANQPPRSVMCCLIRVRRLGHASLFGRQRAQRRFEAPYCSARLIAGPE